MNKNELDDVYHVTNDKRKNSSLSDRYAVPLLIFMLDVEKPKISDFSHIVSSFRTLENLVDNLSQDGLITVSRVTRPYKTTFIELTDKGFKVAKKLKDVESIVNDEEVESSEPDFVSTPSQIRDRVT